MAFVKVICFILHVYFIIAGLSGGEIAGVVIAVLSVMFIVACVLIYFIK